MSESTCSSSVPGADALPVPARYFPPAGGRYEVRPGLSPLGCDFGNGEADRRVCQLDRTWPEYRREKMRARRECLEKYVCDAEPGEQAMRALVDFFTRQLAAEYPRLFRREALADGGIALHCALSGEVLVLDDAMVLRETLCSPGVARPEPGYVSALDALACQVQEDLAFTEVAPGGADRLSALHLCFPNHWAAGDKIGRGFAAIHAPVPGIGRIASRAGRLALLLVDKGPFVRFAWGLATDRRLNHHPVAPADCDDPQTWAGRAFDPATPRLFLRIERQVTRGFSRQGAFLFTVRTYFADVAELGRPQLRDLADAVRSMDAEALRYKGLAGQQAALLAWLDTLAANAL